MTVSPFLLGRFSDLMAITQLHMAGMPRIITSADIDNVSHNEKLNCTYAVLAAKEIARISVEEPSYRDGLRYCSLDLFILSLINPIM